MGELKKSIVKDKFKWKPMDERVDKLGLPFPPRPKEIKSPLLWIAIDPKDKYTQDIYLVNETGKILEAVIANVGGFESFDDDVIGYSGPDIKYEHVENGS